MQAQIRHYSLLDRIIGEVDNALRTVHAMPRAHERPRPDQHLEVEGPGLTAAEQTLAGRLLRVDHCGEVCAQALYHGQAIFARDKDVAERLAQSAEEENDHLAWCEVRLEELKSRPSYFGPIWYMGAFSIGALAGAIGDRWSLGFVIETETQVEAHLESHLRLLPDNDYKSRVILQQMKQDEAEHASAAQAAGGESLPWPIKTVMAATSKVMTTIAYWV